MFMNAQGHETKENWFAQDNQSAMKLEINGRASCGQKSRHIDIRYFFMKDWIKSKDIKVVYCPTEKMLADFFTKPLQGSLFDKFKNVLMGYTNIDKLSPSTLPSTKERVGEKELIIERNDDSEGVKIQGEAGTQNNWIEVKAKRARHGKQQIGDKIGDTLATAKISNAPVATKNNNSKTGKDDKQSFFQLRP